MAAKGVTVSYLAENRGRERPDGLEIHQAPKIVARDGRASGDRALIHEAGEDEQWDYYIVHDNIGVSHVLKKRKGELPLIRRTNCED